METKFKDVAHLYLGVNMQYTGNGNPFRGTKKIEPLTIEKFELLMFSNQRKPILRPLSSMKNIELSTYSDLSKEESNEVFVPYMDKTIYPAAFAYLLKQGFDLFGLIESNQAIDATKLLNPQI